MNAVNAVNAITVRKLNKTYANGTQALKEVDLEIKKGDFFALLGANGAGKTTLIGILTGLVNKTSGETFVFEHNLDTHPIEAKKLIGVVPQEFNFNMFEKVQDIIVTQAGYFGVERFIALKESESLLKKLGLWEKRWVNARSLSGGMKRRLMIARALIHKPRLLILDEPTAGVDVELRHEMWKYLRQLNAEGVTILLTTHYLEEVEQMCRHAAFIKNGIIVKNDTVKVLTQMLDKEIYTITVKKMTALDQFKDFHLEIIDDTTLEVELSRRESLNHFLNQLSSVGIHVTDIRPKGHRLERLFLDMLRE